MGSTGSAAFSCVLSSKAVAALRTRGFNVWRLDQGFLEWKAAGLPIEAAA